MNKGHIPIRMCVICKGRFEQKLLRKFQSKSYNSIRICSTGRSFYLCNACINLDNEILKKRLSKIAKNLNLDKENLKEIFLNGECSDSRNSD